MSRVTDLSIATEISDEIGASYSTALDFIESNPEYSLQKFREILEHLVDILSAADTPAYEGSKLATRIDELHEWQIISYPLRDDFHEVRKLGNVAVHKLPKEPFEGEGESHKTRKNYLVSNAHKARKTVVSIFQDVLHLSRGKPFGYEVILSEVGKQAYRETLYEASVSACASTKLKAGIVCETILREQTFQENLASTETVAAHLDNLNSIAISFFDAACAISADIDSHIGYKIGNYDREKIICRYADPEALYRYGFLAMGHSADTMVFDLGKRRIIAAADRHYAPAEAEYGTELYENASFQDAVTYLERAAANDEPLALRYLYYAYSEGKYCEVDVGKAMEFLDRAIELGCPDSIAELGVAYHQGKITPKNDEKARALLEEAIEKGSIYGKRYFLVVYNDLAGKIQSDMLRVLEIAQQKAEANKPKPYVAESKVGRNDPCPCNSGIKFKKCCGKNH